MTVNNNHSTVATNTTKEVIRHETKIRELEIKYKNLVDAHDHLLKSHRMLRAAFIHLTTHYSMGEEEGLPETFVFPASSWAGAGY